MAPDGPSSWHGLIDQGVWGDVSNGGETAALVSLARRTQKGPGRHDGWSQRQPRSLVFVTMVEINVTTTRTTASTILATIIVHIYTSSY